MTYLKYSPSQEELREIKSNYWEIWEGLPFPFSEFEQVESRGKLESLRYEKDGNYIWVTNETLQIYTTNSNSLFFAMRKKNPRGKIIAKSVDPSDLSLEGSIEKARILNRMGVLNGRKEVVMSRLREIKRQKEDLERTIQDEFFRMYRLK